MPTAPPQARIPPARSDGPYTAEVAEMVLLLPGDQMEALMAAADSERVTTGALVRRVLREFLSAGRGRPDRAGRRPAADGRAHTWPAGTLVIDDRSCDYMMVC